MKKLNSGITIVEILVYIGLLSIFLIIMIDVFTTSVNLKLASESASSLQQDSQFILSKLTSDMSQATSVVEPSNLGETTQTLILDEIVYSLNDGTLTRDGVNLNGTDTQIQNISFTRVGNLNGVPTIKINFEIVSKITKQGQNVGSQVFQTTLGLRQ